MDMELAPTPAFRGGGGASSNGNQQQQQRNGSVAESIPELASSTESLNVSVPIRLLRVLCIIASVELCASTRVNKFAMLLITRHTVNLHTYTCVVYSNTLSPYANY